MSVHALEHLYEISKTLTGLEDVERTLTAAFAIAAATLPIDSAILIEATEGNGAMTVWHAAGQTRGQLRVAKANARAAFTYFTGTGDAVLPLRERAARATLRDPGGASPERSDRPRFLTIPLVVEHEAPFGVLQVEVTGCADTDDLTFVNAFANQLAIALDRLRAWRRDIVLRKQAEAATQRYEALVDNLDRAFVWEADAQTLAMIYVSARATRMLGVRGGQWRSGSDSWMTHIHPKDQGAVLAMLQRARDTGQDQRLDHRCISRGGHLVWLRTGVHLTGADTIQPRLQGVSLEISALKSAEGRVHDQLDFIRTMAESVDEGIIALDLESKLTFSNRAANAMIGRTNPSALGVAIDDAIDMRSPAGEREAFPLQRVIQSGKSIRSAEHIVVRRNGSSLPVRYTASPIRRDRRVTGVVLALEDISALKQAEEAQRFLLEASVGLGLRLDHRSTARELTRLAVPSLGDFCAVVLVDSHDPIRELAVSDADSGEVSLLTAHSGALLDLADALTARATRTGKARVIRDVHDGLLHSLKTSPEHLRSLRGLGVRSLMIVPMGQPAIGAMLFGFARSERRYQPSDRALAEELARRAASAFENGRLYGEAQRAVREREETLAVVSHDLRNPLHVILLSAAMMRHDAPWMEQDATLWSGLDRVTRSAQRMSRMIEDLLDLASIDSGHLAIEKRPCEPASLLEAAVASIDAIANHEGIVLLGDADSGLPAICCDRERVLQVFSNLVGNATKVVPAGGSITVRARAGDGVVVFSVSDNGPGIAATEHESVFARRWRHEGVAYKGSGLGLAICKGIVETHGGRIWVESPPGGGAAFYFTIPSGAGHRSP